MPVDIDIRHVGDKSYVEIRGVVDENANFDALATLRERAEVNLRGVRRINSYGARAWMDALRRVAESTRLEFVECSSPVIDQLNMLEGFLAHAPVRSFVAPLVCERCDVQIDHVFDTREVRNHHQSLPPVECDRCHRPMVLDDLEDQYLLFLREPTKLR